MVLYIIIGQSKVEGLKNKNKASLEEYESVPKTDTADVVLEIDTPTDYEVFDNTVEIANTIVFRKDAHAYSTGDNITTFNVNGRSEETRGNWPFGFE